MDPVVIRETKYIAAGTVVLSVLVQVIWAIFFHYDISVFLGALWGGAVAIGNFALLGVTVQKAASDGDERVAAQRVRTSYHLRLLMIGVMLVVAVAVKWLSWPMAAMSLLFPRLTILVEPLFRKDMKKGGKQ